MIKWAVIISLGPAPWIQIETALQKEIHFKCKRKDFSQNHICHVKGHLKCFYFCRGSEVPCLNLICWFFF